VAAIYHAAVVCVSHLNKSAGTAADEAAEWLRGLLADEKTIDRRNATLAAGRDGSPNEQFTGRAGNLVWSLSNQGLAAKTEHIEIAGISQFCQRSSILPNA